MSSEIEIKAITGEGIIPYLHWLKDTPKRKQVDSESIKSIAVNALQGTYHGLLGLIGGVPVGMLIYYMHNKEHIELKYIYGKRQMSRFYMELMKYFNKYGIKSLQAESYHNLKLWEKLCPGRMKVLRTTYTFDVEGLFNESKSRSKRLEVQTASRVLHNIYARDGSE